MPRAKCFHRIPIVSKSNIIIIVDVSSYFICMTQTLLNFWHLSKNIKNTYTFLKDLPHYWKCAHMHNVHFCRFWLVLAWKRFKLQSKLHYSVVMNCFSCIKNQAYYLSLFFTSILLSPMPIKYPLILYHFHPCWDWWNMQDHVNKTLKIFFWN